MERFSRLLAVAIAIEFAICGAAPAADPRYPDWPCVQAKVPEISVAAVWSSAPLDDAEEAWSNDPRVKDLVLRLTPRRVSIEDAKKIIADFIAGDAVEREE